MQDVTVEFAPRCGNSSTTHASPAVNPRERQFENLEFGSRPDWSTNEFLHNHGRGLLAALSSLLGD